MVLSTALFDRAPFQNCICHGVVLGDDQQKMSKRLKNYPDPTRGLRQLRRRRAALVHALVAADVGRRHRRARDADIGKAMRQAILPIWNAYYFFTLYANIDGVEGEGAHRSEGRARSLHPGEDARDDRGVEGRLDRYDLARRLCGACRRSSRRSTTGTSAAAASASGRRARAPTSRMPSTRSSRR